MKAAIDADDPAGVEARLGEKEEHLDEKNTPLIYAARHGKLKALHALIDGGADVNATNTNEATPLFIACQEGHLPCAELLIKSGAEVDKAANDGATPLYAACEFGHTDSRKATS